MSPIRKPSKVVTSKATGKSSGIRKNFRISKGTTVTAKPTVIDFSKKTFKGLVKQSKLNLDFLSENVFEVDIDTVESYQQGTQKVPTALKEQIARLTEIYQLGEDLFGSRQVFNEWIRIPNIGLNNIEPIKFFSTVNGLQLVFEELKRIEFGATA